MSEKPVLKPISIAAGTVIATALAATPVAYAAENPFSMQPLSSGYMVVAEGKCGEGKCGSKQADDGKAAEQKCGENKCGGRMQDKQCKMQKMDTDGDGKVSREEFMKKHEAKFDRIDANSDGVIDDAEHEAYRAEKYGKSMESKCGGAMGSGGKEGEGKCGEGKCGGKK